MAHPHSRVVLPPGSGDVYALTDYLPVFYHEEGPFQAVDSDPNVVSHFQLLRRSDPAHLNSPILYLALVEEEISAVVAERVVSAAQMLLGSVVFGHESDVYGILGRRPQHFYLEIPCERVVFQRILGSDDLIVRLGYGGLRL